MTRIHQAVSPAPARRAAVAPPIVGHVLASAGRPLESQTRALLEPRFGHDFGAVRVHVDGRAAESARAMNARAYTVGTDVVFDAGQYAPRTPAGLRLIAHELAHTIQQRGLPRPAEPLRLGERSSPHERAADDAAARVESGRPAPGGPPASRPAVQMVQRAEYGTYVSTVGDPTYLDAGYEFYKRWGHPNVKRASSMLDVLTDLGKSTAAIDRFRIVSHGSSVGLQFGLMPEMAPDTFGATESEFTTDARFRKHIADLRLVSESFTGRILQAMQKDATTQPLLARLGADQTIPAPDTPLGILLRSMIDTHYLAAVRLPVTDPSQVPGAPAIANKAALDLYNSSRFSTYKTMVVDAAPADKQKDLRTDIDTLAAEVGGAMARAKLSFSALSQTDADTLADPVIEDAPGGGKQLRKEISKSITEGAVGPYLGVLKKARSKITDQTHLEIRGCNVGSNTTLLDKFRDYFGTPATGASAAIKPSISAPDLYQYFFALNYVAYGSAPSEEQNLQTAFGDPATGLAQDFEQRKRIAAGEITVVVNEPTLKALSTKYGYVESELVRLNPEYAGGAVSPGATVWRVSRRNVPAGNYKTLREFCIGYLGSDAGLADVEKANPQLTAPSGLPATEKDRSPRLTSSDVISVPDARLPTPIASAAPTGADVSAAIRGAKPVPTMDRTTSRPVLHMDYPKWAESLGGWLASQRFDPKGRTAEALTKLYAGQGFQTTVARTYIQFLSRTYPTIEDPIFPDDPRYDKHIIHRP